MNLDDQKPAIEQPKEKGTFKAFLSCVLTVIIGGGIIGLIGGKGTFSQRAGNGAFCLALFIVGFALQCYIGAGIGWCVSRTDKGVAWGTGIAAILFVFGIFPIISFFKIKVPF